MKTKSKFFSQLGIKIADAAFHRNGICGLPFYVILFDSKENGRMVATLFREEGSCAVYKVDELVRENIAFGEGNSWRGDMYEVELRPFLDEFLMKRDGFKAWA